MKNQCNVTAKDFRRYALGISIKCDTGKTHFRQLCPCRNKFPTFQSLRGWNFQCTSRWEVQISIWWVALHAYGNHGYQQTFEILLRNRNEKRNVEATWRISRYEFPLEGAKFQLGKVQISETCVASTNQFRAYEFPEVQISNISVAGVDTFPT